MTRIKSVKTKAALTIGMRCDALARFIEHEFQHGSPWRPLAVSGFESSGHKQGAPGQQIAKIIGRAVVPAWDRLASQRAAVFEGSQRAENQPVRVRLHAGKLKRPVRRGARLLSFELKLETFITGQENSRVRDRPRTNTPAPGGCGWACKPTPQAQTPNIRPALILRACLKIRPVGGTGLKRIGILAVSCRPRAP